MENDDFENEIWKDIADFPNYQISNYGRVKSFMPYHGTNERILKPKKDTAGYLFVCLFKNGKRYYKLIHRLVASAFIPNDDILKTQINHIDENKENNHVSNLEWCTAQYNIEYSQAKQVIQYDFAGNFIQSFQSTHEIEKQLGFNPSNISECCNGKRKSANGYIWRFA